MTDNLNISEFVEFTEIKHIDIAEFRKTGYLQELNREFLHPLGLALEVIVHEDGTEELGGIWDYRDDPSGIAYDEIDETKADVIREIWHQRWRARTETLGYMIQPVKKSESRLDDEQL